jgi:hypothetical protein
MKGLRTIGFNLGALVSAPWLVDIMHQTGLVPEGQEVTVAVITMAVANAGLRLVTDGPVGAGGGGLARWITNTVIKELARRRAELKAKQEK